MATMTEKAARGQRDALEYLYGQNKKKIYSIAKCLLLDEQAATQAAIQVFGDMWGLVSAQGEMSEEAFAAEAAALTVSCCKKIAARQNSKAFRIPPNKNFRIAGGKARDNSEPFTDFLLRQLPELHRFAFLSHALCKFDSAQTAKCLHIPQGLIELAFESEQRNIETLLAAAGSGAPSFQQLVADLEEEASHQEVPAKADEHARSVIDGIAKPVEQKKKKKLAIAGAAAAACLAVVIGLACLFGLGNANSGNGTPAEESEAVLPEESETAVSEPGTESGAQSDETPNAESNADAAASGLDESLTYYADIEIKDYGTVTVKLDQASAPVTAANFVNLAESGFYNGLTFHRIIKGFMMQGGDPNGDGTGGSEQTIVGEFSENGYKNALSHTRGAIAMARSSDMDSASSQFYIVHEDSEFLDGQYAVFGYVTEGMEIVDAVCEAAAPTDDNGTIPAEAQPVISSVAIRAD